MQVLTPQLESVTRKSLRISPPAVDNREVGPEHGTLLTSEESTQYGTHQERYLWSCGVSIPIQWVTATVIQARSRPFMVDCSPPP